jgi:outer membrane immunogenic protein
LAAALASSGGRFCKKGFLVKRILIAAALAATTATPALAQEANAAPASDNAFTGARIGAEIGLADDDIFGTESFTYGLEAGYDFDLGGAVVGPTVGLQDSDDTGREFSAGGRLGAKVGDKALIYGAVAYSNLKVADHFKLDGVRFGLGVEYAPAEHVYIKAEQRYANYELGAELWQTVLGVGFRF